MSRRVTNENAKKTFCIKISLACADDFCEGIKFGIVLPGRLMMKLADYEIRDCLYRGTRSQVYRALRCRDKSDVILKVHAHEFPRQTEVARFRREYEIGQHFSHELIVAYLGLEAHHHGLALVLEDFGGVSLVEVTPETGLDVESFLDKAIQIVNALHIVHQQGIIHKDIKPANILIHPETSQIKLTDFGISTHLVEPAQVDLHSEFLEGTIAYISPEQTGRMNRKVDYRSDFYSLGVTFYELLCGHLPFNAMDTSEMIHCHIARLAQPLYLVKPSVPRVLSDLVARLMSKCAEDRYQSSLGLRADLERCREMQKASGLTAFALGERDLNQRFELSQKLYGRDRELAKLMDVVERVEAGSREFVLVCGPMGSGKSMLLGEIQKTIVDKRGYFIAGKFHQENQEQPFAAVICAMRDLLRQILVENDARVNVWKHALRKALGENIGILVEVLPELERIVGRVPHQTTRTTHDSDLRFNHALRQLVLVCVQRQVPMAFLLEDLHQADHASLRLMMQLFEAPEVSHFTLLSTFAGREIPAEHMLSECLQDLKGIGVEVTHLQLAPLQKAEIISLLTETLHTDVDQVALLADVVARKTKGNAYFVCEFLKTLSHKGLVQFDNARGQWCWDLRAINAMEMTPNVVNLLVSQIRALPGRTCHCLSLAAVLGSQFDLKTLEALTGLPADDLVNDLWPALETGLIVSMGPIEMGHADQSLCFKFSHDRLQTVAYELLDPAQLPRIHLQIGRLMLQQQDHGERRLFELIGHLNLGRPLIEDMAELIYLIKADLLAAKKAIAAGSYTSAAKNLALAMQFLPPDAWQHEYETVFDLFVTRAHCSWLIAENKEAELLLFTLLEHAHPGIDALRAHVLMIDFYTQCNRPEKATALAATAFPKFGLGNVNATKMQAWCEIRWLDLRLSRTEPGRFLQLPELSDPQRLAVLELLRSTCNAFYQTGAMQSFRYITARLVRLSLAWGRSPSGAYAFVCYGMSLRQRGKLGARPLRFGRLGVEMVKQFPESMLRSRIHFMYGSFLEHWHLPLRSCEMVLEESRRIGMENGDPVFSVWSIFAKCLFGLFAGKFLRNLDEELQQLERYLHQTGARFEFPLLTILRQLVRYHLGLTPDPKSLDEDSFNEDEMLNRLAKRKYLPGIAFIHYARMHVRYHQGDYCAAWSSAQAYLEVGSGLAATPVAVEAQVLICLIRFAMIEQEDPKTQALWLRSIRATTRSLGRQAELCPENFRHKALMLRAELARYEGRDAADLYDLALEDAYDHSFPQNVALINELAGRYWLARGRRKVARAYFNEAISGYQSWGAVRKLDALRTQFQGFLLEGEQRRKPLDRSTSDESGSSPEHQHLDVKAITKAVLAISSEIDFRKLVGKMLAIMMENAGAQRGFLVLTSSGAPRIHAYGEGPKIELMQGRSIQECTNLAASIVRFVIRSGESVVLEDANDESMFSKDPYILEQRPRSVLCIPIRQMERIAGALYLENNLTKGAFNDERVKTLGILLAQAAFCLEHSRLFTESIELNQALKREIDERKSAEEVVRQLNVDLEQRVRERTAQLERSQQELLERAHAAGMADIATSVLHNVGNILSSITTSSQLIRSSVEAPTLNAYSRANQMLRDNIDDLESFMRDNPKGPMLMQFYLELEKLLQRDYGKMKENLVSLMAKVDTIRDVIMAQQSFASGGFRTEPMLLAKVVDDAISILDNSLNRHEIQLLKRYDHVPPVVVQKAKLSHTIINILKNAKEAMLNVTAGEKRIIIEIDCDKEFSYLRITDVGCGIEKKDMEKIFNHGYTTKKNGHGFGLHSCANAMTEMGGCLRVESPGPGQGATFIMQFPMSIESESAASEQLTLSC